MRSKDLAVLCSHLTKAARAHRLVTYGELMRLYNLSRGRSLSAAIEEVDRREYEEGRLGFAAIIVRKDTGYPGGGYFCDDSLPPRLRRPRSRASDPKLSQPEQKYIGRLQRKIWTFYSCSGEALSVHSCTQPNLVGKPAAIGTVTQLGLQTHIE